MEGNKTSNIDLKELRIDPMKSHPFTSPDPTLPSPTVILSSGISSPPAPPPSTHAGTTIEDVPQPPLPPPPPAKAAKGLPPPAQAIAATVAATKVAKERAEALHQAAKKGDWRTAKGILQQKASLVRTGLSKDRDTALHVAAAAGHSRFVRELLQVMEDRDDVAVKNVKGYTPLYCAAIHGNVEIARLMVEKDNDLPLIRCQNNKTPLAAATFLGLRKMAQFLIYVTDFHGLTLAEQAELLVNSIDSGLYDIALELWEKFSRPVLVEEAYAGLQRLVEKQLNFKPEQAVFWISICGLKPRQNKNVMQDHALQLTHRLWEDVLEGTNNTLFNVTVKGLLTKAVELCNVEFFEITFIHTFSREIWSKFEDDTIISLVVLSRRVDIFKMIYQDHGLLHSFVDWKKNTVLHLVAKSPPAGILNRVPGAALQMQRELLWYKQVENIVEPQFRDLRNSDGITPRSLFTLEHEKLRVKGEEWTKATAASCSTVATLITTVVFAAAFTVPGGNNQDKGIPIFQQNPIFVVFAVADALSLSSSSAAILIFLGILISPSSEEDFLISLPRKLMMGVALLFISIVCMMVAFTSSFFIIFKTGLAWIPIPVVVSLLAALPVILFAYQQFPLVAEIYHLTQQARHCLRPRKIKMLQESFDSPRIMRLWA